MALPNEELSREQVLEAQAHIWNHMFTFIKSISLKCAVELGIPDIIHSHGKPMKLSELVDALPIHKSKSPYIHRFIRLLVHSEFFIKANNVVSVSDETKEEEEEEEEEEEDCYWLTPASRLLLRDASFTLAPLVLIILDPIFTKPWSYMSEWLANEQYPFALPFETAHGLPFWEIVGREPRLSDLFNEAMSSDTGVVAPILASDSCKHVFEGIESLVDVGGGTGTMGKAIVDAFPHIKCVVVLDLPHVVAGLEGTERLTYVGGDMFHTIPPANAVLLKYILHNWNDEDCARILKKCNEAIPGKGKGGGKVIIMDIILNVYGDEGGDKAKEAQLLFDMEMMSNHNGRERSEKELAKLFFDAGFTSYKITPAFGVRSLIEVFP